MARLEFKPRPYQHLIIDYIINNPRCSIWAGMGTGKTSSTLTAIDLLFLSGSINPPVLVIAPLRVASATWVDEVEKWQHLSDMRVIAVVGKPQERLLKLQTNADIYTINYENIPWLVETLGDDWQFSTVIADESTKLKNYRARKGGKRAKYLAKVAHSKVTRWVNLTGTPSPNGLIDLWGQQWFTDKGKRLGVTFTGFKDRWFRSIPIGTTGFFKTEPYPFAQDEIQNALQDCCLSIQAEDYFDIKEPIQTRIDVDLPPKVMKLYKDFEREMFIEIANEEIEAMSAAAKTQKCLQLASGAVYTESGEWIEVHKAKLQALESIVEEAAGTPVLVAYHFKSDLARLRKHFPQGKELDANPKTIRDWNKGKIPILFAHPASAGHGLNLQDGGNILAFFSHWWDLEQYQQILERIGPTRQAQAGHNRPVFIYHIVAKGTLDQAVIERRDSKKTVQEILLESMKPE
ncbi:DEAD/DEAH box helicase [Pasteurella atlantica]|uniref:DEAD/DEAH box helicase n=2 Tax=Pasteurellaceae TaxID=712 RepID=A0ACC6HJF9_9PAST|nr:DEAD/DEAH box helicase [Pasteurella atlantica]MDP8051015.1 DEAD/DEAH box helicase [Pasteurella atlantica]MDP8104311.1 DEAD/DEAH box helicase [Pasteurella atlantica]MDP8147671.1 DEAD/DEAH box helicase [Pasteurella atlantica]